jgi:hypothetical protein
MRFVPVKTKEQQANGIVFRLKGGVHRWKAVIPVRH